MTFACSRIQHYLRINVKGDVSPCCVMEDVPKFSTFEEMLESEWYSSLLEQQNTGKWPSECSICLEQEKHNQQSIRSISNKKDKILKKINPNYRVLDVNVTNVCNSACQTCSSRYSSYYAKIEGKKKIIENGGESKFKQYLNDDVLQIEISGGEPLYSKSHRKFLEDLPANVRWIRINTNGSLYYDFTDILEKGIIIELTVSLDAIGKAFEYIRWPLKWADASENFDRWLSLRSRFPNRFKLGVNYTVSALNIGMIDEMKKWTSARNVGLSYNQLRFVDVLDIRYRNRFTKRSADIQYDFPIAWDRDNDAELERWLEMNDKMRKINYRDYLEDNNG